MSNRYTIVTTVSFEGHGNCDPSCLPTLNSGIHASLRVGMNNGFIFPKDSNSSVKLVKCATRFTGTTEESFALFVYKKSFLGHHFDVMQLLRYDSDEDPDTLFHEYLMANSPLTRFSDNIYKYPDGIVISSVKRHALGSTEFNAMRTYLDVINSEGLKPDISGLAVIE